MQHMPFSSCINQYFYINNGSHTQEQLQIITWPCSSPQLYSVQCIEAFRLQVIVFVLWPAVEGSGFQQKKAMINPLHNMADKVSI